VGSAAAAVGQGGTEDGTAQASQATISNSGFVATAEDGGYNVRSSSIQSRFSTFARSANFDLALVAWLDSIAAYGWRSEGCESDQFNRIHEATSAADIDSLSNEVFESFGSDLLSRN
jgi:hypothetical protein